MRTVGCSVNEQTKGWTKLKPKTWPACDICARKAVWSHPEGGFRCERCPRPDK